MDDISKRFLIFIDHLLSTKQAKSQAEIARNIGVGSASISEVKKDRSNVGAKVLSGLAKQYNTLNGNWLLYGIGPMLLESSVVTVDLQGERNCVYVNVKARAGYLTGYADAEFISQLPPVYLPQLPRGKDFRMFEVDGDSMWPTLKDKDIVICHALSRSGVKDNQLCVVVCSDGVLVKRVFNRVKEVQQLILKSDNQEKPGLYPDIAVPAKDVREVWQVFAYISRQLQDANNPETIITALRADLDRLLKLIPPNLNP